MTVQVIKRWGNSLAVRIPSSMAEQLHLREDQELEIEVVEGTLRFAPTIKTFNWEEYREQLAKMPNDLHPTLDKGKAVGTELSDPISLDDW